MRAFTAAAVQIAPDAAPLTRETIAGNCAKGAEWMRRCAGTSGAVLLVLPESASTGFMPGVAPDELWDLIDAVPGALTEPLQEAARATGTHVVWGTYERGTVFNSAVLIGPDGAVLGTYRKAHGHRVAVSPT